MFEISALLLAMGRFSCVKKGGRGNLQKPRLLLLAAIVLLVLMTAVAVWQAPPLFPSTDSSATVSTRPKLDVNTATAEELTAVPGVDDQLSVAIIAKRERIGRYENLYQLQSVPGMTKKKWEDLQEYLIVYPKTP